jgi:hypothetical protein
MIDHGDLTMRKRSFLFLSLLVPAFFRPRRICRPQSAAKDFDGQREALV